MGTPVLEVDLHLHRTLDALLSRRSVQRAARHLGLSQPAASHALNRLRATFADALLVRASRGMALTTREALGRMEAVFTDAQAFDPSTCRRTFTLALPEHAQLVLGAPLAQVLSAEAPGVKWVFRGLPEELEDALESGRADLVLSIPAPASPAPQPPFQACARARSWTSATCTKESRASSVRSASAAEAPAGVLQSALASPASPPSSGADRRKLRGLTTAPPGDGRAHCRATRRRAAFPRGRDAPP